MKIHVLEDRLTYDGLQLSTGFFDEHECGEEDALIVFVGEADVPTEHMVDMEDADAGESIYSRLMAHLLIEHHAMELREAVLAQRMLVRLAAEWISARSGSTLDVQGDDLYLGDGKLSVSVATRSARSCLLHLGVNIDGDGAPVKTSSLRDMRVSPEEFLKGLARAYTSEMDSVKHAVGKVRHVS